MSAIEWILDGLRAGCSVQGGGISPEGIDNAATELRALQERVEQYDRASETVDRYILATDAKYIALVARVEAQQKMLKRLGFRKWWNDAREQHDVVCVMCQAKAQDAWAVAHAPDCELAALLKETTADAGMTMRQVMEKYPMFKECENCAHPKSYHWNGDCQQPYCRCPKFVERKEMT